MMGGPDLLARYLRDAQLSQLAFAAKCGVDQSHLSRYLTRRRTPGRTNASLISTATSGAVPPESWDARPRRPRRHRRPRAA